MGTFDRIRGLFGTPAFIRLRQNPIADLPGEFCNDPNGDEWHSIWMGFFSPLDREPFDTNLIPVSYPAGVREYVLREYHYYRFGRWLGRLFLLILGSYVATNTIIPVVF